MNRHRADGAAAADAEHLLRLIPLLRIKTFVNAEDSCAGVACAAEEIAFRVAPLRGEGGVRTAVASVERLAVFPF